MRLFNQQFLFVDHYDADVILHADSFPFSSSEVPKILQFFSISSLSPKAKAVKDTVRTCEIEPAIGETKICATSSESMLEFVRNAFGADVDFELVSTSHPTMTTQTLQSYTIMEPPREIESPEKVACHPLPYLYAVYMCHYDAFETKIFKVALVGENGDKVDTLIVCHLDTSTWSPKHAAFSLLGTKPGMPCVPYFVRRSWSLDSVLHCCCNLGCNSTMFNGLSDLFAAAITSTAQITNVCSLY
ncbi:putative Organ-specific protein S2 [Hibiscus syriacus]|uniref:Organ-specific protein S2 n=1 Tax=Hibiscus syriacus TaxID=106335 RepID=A0A6A2Y2V7_HIBSY|nr:putative Organ-specific protein S2 [Hibiscus syriacus]